MAVLLVEMTVAAGNAKRLEETFDRVFRPAISAQDGFVSVRLLRPRSGDRWFLEIEFADEPARLRWVATDLHQEVWPQMEQHCSKAEPSLYDASR